MEHNTQYPKKIAKLNINESYIDELWDNLHSFVSEGGKAYVISPATCVSRSDFRARVQEVVSAFPNSYPLQIRNDEVIIFADKKECNGFRNYLRYSTDNSLADMLSAKIWQILEGR